MMNPYESGESARRPRARFLLPGGGGDISAVDTAGAEHDARRWRKPGAAHPHEDTRAAREDVIHDTMRFFLHDGREAGTPRLPWSCTDF